MVDVSDERAAILHQLLAQPRLRAADLGKVPERPGIYVIYLHVPDPLCLKLGIAGPSRLLKKSSESSPPIRGCRLLFVPPSHCETVRKRGNRPENRQPLSGGRTEEGGPQSARAARDYAIAESASVRTFDDRRLCERG